MGTEIVTSVDVLHLELLQIDRDNAIYILHVIFG